MKTILITIFHGAAAKNILRTKVIKALLTEPHVRVICLLRFPERALSYQKEILHERITYDSFYGIPGGMLERLFSFLKFRLIKTATTDLRHRMSYDQHKNYPRYVASLLFNRMMARSSVRRVLRFFDYYFIGDPGFGAVLEKHRPDVVVLTNLFDDGEIALLREAKKRRIPAVGFINSWDKLSARCALRLLPDTLIVFNEIVKQEAMAHADMPEANISVCGIPQYDQYVSDPPTSRKVFFEGLGLDPAKRLILYSPRGIKFSASDWVIIDFLHDAISRGRIENAELLVRFPPNDFLDEGELSRRRWLKYDLPGIRFGTKRSVDWDMDFKELQHLTDTLTHASVVVGYTSSIAIDAAIFDKPVIGVNFEVRDGLPLAESPTQYYATEHFTKALRTGGIHLVRSKEELIEAVNAYLRDPSRDQEARRRLKEEQCWRLDGKSGERIASAVLEALNPKPETLVASGCVMKTIFITCFNGFISRNILSTDAFSILKAGGDIRIVIFAPEKRAPTLREEYGEANVLVEGIEISSKTIEKPSERFMWVLATNLLRTQTRYVQRRVKFARGGNLADYLFSILISFLGRFGVIRNAYRFAASRIVPGTEFEKYFDTYRPDLLFAADVYTPQDAKMMRCAKRRNIPVIGMVRSWDNVTSKTLLTHIPDYMVVNSECVKREAMYYGDVPEKRIFVCGVPHYDRYLSFECAPRDIFMKKHGLDPKRKMILFATPGDNYLENNPITPFVLESLKDIDANIFVRLPLVGKEDLKGYILPKNAVLDDPGNYQNFTQVHVTQKADRHLANCLNASDIVITWASTMILDAAVFNKPTILVDFDATPRPYHYSIVRYYDYEHHQFILGSGGVRLAKSPEELRYWVSRYLVEPRLDEEGRKKIVKEYCGDMDGRAGRRLGDFLLERLTTND